MTWDPKAHVAPPIPLDGQTRVVGNVVGGILGAGAVLLGAKRMNMNVGMGMVTKGWATGSYLGESGAEVMHDWLYNSQPRYVGEWKRNYSLVDQVHSVGDYKLTRSTGRSLRGRGDYSYMPMQTNQIVKGSGQHPLLVNSGKDLSGDVYFSHREFVGNVTAQATGTAGTSVQSAFQVNEYPINAAIAKTFPWLSQTAQNWVLYEFEGLMFEYRPTSGEFGNLSTNALGKVIMATQYDPDAAKFGQSVQMENYDYATACKPAEHMVHGVETKTSQRAVNMLYTRTGNTTKDRVFTDLGVFQIATEGIPMTLTGSSTVTNTIVIGELWVSYRVKLSRANLFSNILGNDVRTDVFRGYSCDGTNANNYVAFGGGNAPAVWNNDKFASYYNLSPIAANSAMPCIKNTIGVTLTSAVFASTNSELIFTFPSTITQGAFKIKFMFKADGGVKCTAETYGTVGQILPNPASTAFVQYGDRNSAGVTTVTSDLCWWPSGLGFEKAPLNDTALTDAGDWLYAQFYIYVNAPGTSQAVASFIVNGTNWIATKGLTGGTTPVVTTASVEEVPLSFLGKA